MKIHDQIIHILLRIEKGKVPVTILNAHLKTAVIQMNYRQVRMDEIHPAEHWGGIGVCSFPRMGCLNAGVSFPYCLHWLLPGDRPVTGHYVCACEPCQGEERNSHRLSG